MIIEYYLNNTRQQCVRNKCKIQIQSGEVQRIGRRALWKLGFELNNNNKNHPLYVHSLFIYFLVEM